MRRFIKWFWAVFDTKLFFSPVKHPKYLGGWLLDTIHSIILHLGQIAGDFWPCLRAKTLFLTWKPIHKIYLWIYWTGNPLNLLPTLECEDIGAKTAKFSHPEMVLAKLKQKIESIIAIFCYFQPVSAWFWHHIGAKLSKTGQLDLKLSIFAILRTIAHQNQFCAVF